MEPFETDIPSEIRDAYARACEVLGPLDFAYAWAEALGADMVQLAAVRVKLEEQIALDRAVLAAKLERFRRGDLSADEFTAWVDTDLTPEALLRHARLLPGFPSTK